MLSAVLTLGHADDGASARPRAVLAALCLADEPDSSVELADRVIERLIDAIDERDGGCARHVDEDERRAARSELDEAAIELASSQWREHLVVGLECLR